ncbi:MAG: hypothetical protein RIT14_2091 [Pseudomonadota bacterium]|jgi:hypothetical protein
MSDPAARLPDPDLHDWCQAMEDLCDEDGYFEPLGPALSTRHWAFFHDDGPRLLVTFEDLATIRARPDQRPMGREIALARGWSHLCLIADGPTWYRDPAVFGYVDRLVDDAFFEDFDSVLFYGAGTSGHAACAFSVAAPGAQVLAINPRATLDPALAGWDRRDIAARRLDFTSRYGFAPDMTEGAARLNLLYDPTSREDAMHAALFRAPWITRHAIPRLGAGAEQALLMSGLLAPLIDAAMEGTLDPAQFARLWRARRNLGPYLRALVDAAEAQGHPARALRICRHVTARTDAPRFRRRQQALEAALTAAD